MGRQYEKISWKKTSNVTWAPATQRGYDAVIAYDNDPETATPYGIIINPGAVVSDHTTLRQAKNEFRKFLFDKPVF